MAAEDAQPSPAGSTTLFATYSGDYGFALEPASADSLASMLAPGEQVVAVVDGERKPLRSVAWADLRDRSGSYRIEAVTKSGTRALGEMQLLPPELPQCGAADELASPADPFALVSRPEAGPAHSELAACTNNTRAYFCINCQCRSGIYVKGLSQRHICIYGTWYPEEVYSCDCGFTTRICNVST